MSEVNQLRSKLQGRGVNGVESQESRVAGRSLGAERFSPIAYTFSKGRPAGMENIAPWDGGGRGGGGRGEVGEGGGGGGGVCRKE